MEKPRRNADPERVGLGKIKERALERHIPVICEETEKLLRIIVKIKAPERILEIGTAVGYSGAVMLETAPKARLYTVEKDADRCEEARENFIRLGMEERVNVINGDAEEILPMLTGSYDLVFMDGPKGKYEVFLPYITEMLKEEKQQEPFFKIVQTSSSHEPFEVPFYRLDDKVLNAFAYADSCVGDFVRQYKETPMWKNTLIVLVPDHLGAYPRPVENPLEGHTIPLILIGGAVKEPRVVDTYASQIDIAATLLSQLGLPHDDFTFSKNIFNPSSPHFGYFTEPTLFGMVTAENQLVYNLDANTVQIDEGTEKGANLEKGKAFLQKLYDDLAKR